MEQLLMLFLMYSCTSFLYSVYQTRVKNNYFGLSYMLIPLGAFVWTDGVVFGLFWTIASIVMLILNQFFISLLIFSLFWTVRSAGEVIYWFLEQFASRKRNPPPSLLLYHFFPNESVWIVMQLLWQCMLVISLLIDIVVIKHL